MQGYLLILLVLFSGLTHADTHEKIIYHLHGTQPGSFATAVANLENLINGMSEKPLDIKLLLQGKSIQLLNTSRHSQKFNRRIQNLRNQGISIEADSANYAKNQFLLEDSPKPILVKNIFARIIDLQKQGYHYVTP